MLLTGFVRQFMDSNRTKGWNPLFLIIRSNGKIVGAVSLMVKRWLGLRMAEFLHEDWLAPDFVFSTHYREVCIDSLCKYLLEKLRCHLVRFYLPAESPNLRALENRLRSYGADFSIREQSRHSVIPVDCSWDEFQSRKGRRRKIRQIERKLNKSWPWEIECIRNFDGGPSLPERILGIEARSWKQSPQNSLRDVSIEQILMIIEGASAVRHETEEFDSDVWFLNVNHVPVAYTLTVKYKGTGYIVKTSYDQKYAKTYVGKYLNNLAIQDMFSDGETKNIDFMASYPFMDFWTKSSVGHVGFSILRGKGATALELLQQRTSIPKLWRTTVNSWKRFRLRQ